MGVELPKLVLPKRFEALERRAEETGTDLLHVVERVRETEDRVANLLRQARDGGIGRFEFLLGKSGSGKTTFLATLSHFFNNIEILRIRKGDCEFANIPEFIRAQHLSSDENRLYIIEGRDNPRVTDSEVAEFFDDLRQVFRTPEGQVVVIWPITDEDAADRFADIAWEVGRDSLLDPDVRVYQFHGLQNTQFYRVADTTVTSLTGGRSLESFGLPEQDVRPIQRESETISEFYHKIEQRQREINEEVDDILEERAVPRVWILLAGDDSRELDGTVASLTQGTAKHVDVDRLCQFLDQPDLNAQYLKDWKARRSKAAYLMGLFDVRIVDLPPNVSLAAIRAFGTEKEKDLLESPYASEGDARKQIQKSLLFKLITSQHHKPSRPRPTADSTAREYLRVQQTASSSDKPLNRALASALQNSIDSEDLSLTVSAEKRSLPGSSLLPDIIIRNGPTRPICLEPTWRSTGQGVEDEIPERQNTLTPGHIQVYMLRKVLEYAKDFGF